MKYKLICSDLDDTLLNSEGKVSSAVKNAITRYVDAGGKFCLVTGRMTSGARPVCAELGLTGELITYQGAMVTDIATGKVLEEISVKSEDAAEIGRYLEDKGVYYQTYVGDVFITEKANEYTVLYGKLSSSDYMETGMKLSDYILLNNINPPKLLIMGKSEYMPILEEELKGKFSDKFRINTSKPFLLEIIPKHISKAVAVDKLVKKYNLTKEEIICIGDSENDIPMLDYAGLGVAVDNATNVVKSHAEVIAPNCDEDGVAWTIDKYGFLK